ncbi:MAG: hypothetical protein J7L43_00730, partial [Candidatus Aenigmarchaeota archaeon]|nr:hypothetical protein [Candidatus Aenigmarchaeota archaeon]
SEVSYIILSASQELEKYIDSMDNKVVENMSEDELINLYNEGVSRMKKKFDELYKSSKTLEILKEKGEDVNKVGEKITYGLEAFAKNALFLVLFNNYLEREASDDLGEIKQKMREYMKKIGIEEFEKAYYALLKADGLDI